MVNQILFHRWGNQAPEKLNTWFKATLPISVKAVVPTGSLAQSLCFQPLHLVPHLGLDWGTSWHSHLPTCLLEPEMVKIYFVFWRISHLDFLVGALLFDSGIILLLQGKWPKRKSEVERGQWHKAWGRPAETIVRLERARRVRLLSGGCGIHERRWEGRSQRTVE